MRISVGDRIKTIYGWGTVEQVPADGILQAGMIKIDNTNMIVPVLCCGPDLLELKRIAKENSDG